MQHTIEQLINMLLHKTEQLEETTKQHSDLKNLTPKQLVCLELIYKMDNPTPSEIARKLGIAKPSATVMIDRMADNGFITKIKSDNDRRSAHVHLTEKGKAAALIHTNLHIAIAGKLTQNLTESELSILTVLLDKALKSFN